MLEPGVRQRAVTSYGWWHWWAVLQMRRKVLLMKLTRKRAIEKIIQEYENTPNGFSDFEWAKNAVDYGIVLGLQMALDDNPNGYDKPATYMAALRRLIARRIRILEKAR